MSVLDTSAEIPVDASLAMDSDDDHADDRGSIVSSTVAVAATDELDDELNDTETLAMSDSDDEMPKNETIAPVVDTARDSDSSAADKNTHIVETAKPKAKKKVKKRATDTHAFSSDDEETFTVTKASLSVDKQTSVAATKKRAPKRVNKKLTVGDDDSSNASANKSKLTTKLNALCDDDEDSGVDQQVTAKSAPKRVVKTVLSDDDSGDDVSSDEHEASATKMLSALCDEDSSDDGDYKAPDDVESATPTVATPRPPKRASAREADDQMKLIQSETQRLMREASISVPYHRPKQHSLKAFLGRRTVTAPTDVRPSVQRPAASIKMSGEQLEVYARNLEERALESQQFFKSDDSDIDEAVAVAEPETVDANAAPSENETTDAVAADDAADGRPDEPQSAATCTIPQPKDAPMSRLDRLKERINAQLTPANSPSLKGAANTIIDLDTGAVLPARKDGLTELYERLLKHSKPSTAAAGGNTGAALRVLSADAMGVSMETMFLSENLSGNGKEGVIIQDSKPRSAFFKLKAELGKKLAQNRSEEIAKRKREMEGEMKAKKAVCSEEEEEQEGDEDEDNEECGEEKNNDDDEGKPVDTMADDEADNDDTDEEEEENDDENSDDSDVDIADKNQPRKRIILAADSDDEEAYDDTGVSSMRLNNAPDDALAVLAENIAVLDDVHTQNDEVTESQLADLCSGVFQTQMPAAAAIEVTDEAAAEAEFTNDLVADAMATVRATFESSDEEDNDAVDVSKKLKNKAHRVIKKLSDDEDETDDDVEQADDTEATDGARLVEYDSEENEIASDVVKTKKKKRKQTAAKTTGESSSSSSSEDDAGGDNGDNDPGAADAIVEYDSDENVVKVVRQTKAERQRRAAAYIENEAELSESEWGSADEDEHQLDSMDVELGDTEHFDNDQLREELGRIHMRRLLDADQREVRIISDQLLKVEEMGAQRERQFKWKNMNDTNWASEGDALAGGGDLEAGSQQPASDDENEEEWRKMRYEREQMLRDLKSRPATEERPDEQTAADEVTVVGDGEALNGTLPENGAGRKRKITVIRRSGTPQQLQSAKEPSFLIGKATEFQVTIKVRLAHERNT